MVGEELRKKVLTVRQVDEVGLLLSKVRALAVMLNQASGAEHGYLNSHTVMTLSIDMMKNLDQIEATLGI